MMMMMMIWVPAFCFTIPFVPSTIPLLAFYFDNQVGVVLQAASATRLISLFALRMMETRRENLVRRPTSFR